MSSARQKAPDRMKAKRYAAVEQGRCGECVVRMAKPGRRTCQTCLDRHAETRRKNLAKGLCPCGAEPRSGRVMCEACAADQHATYIRRKERDIADGTCIKCHTAMARPYRRHCGPCAAAHAAAVSASRLRAREVR